MARFRRIPLEELQRMSYPDVARYLAELSRVYTKKQPRIYRRLNVSKVVSQEGFTRSPNEIIGVLNLIKRFIKEGRNLTEGMINAYNDSVEIASSSYEKYTTRVIWSRANDYMDSILEKGRRFDEYVIQWAQETWSTRNWGDFFKSRYFQQIYLEYRDENDNLYSIDMAESPDIMEFAMLDKNGLSPWTRRMVDWAKKREIDFVEWARKNEKAIRETPLKTKAKTKKKK